MNEEVRDMKAIKMNFECPSCGNILKKICPADSVAQMKKTLEEPSSCGCGRKGKFKLFDFVITELEEVQK